jgi:hypothetical protein
MSLVSLVLGLADGKTRVIELLTNTITQIPLFALTLTLLQPLMDGGNNQPNPQNTQNRQLTNASSVQFNQILQNGVTPEQYAENARQLDTYSRINAMGLQVYLQRQTQLAEQRRQDE